MSSASETSNRSPHISTCEHSHGLTGPCGDGSRTADVSWPELSLWSSQTCHRMVRSSVEIEGIQRFHHRPDAVAEETGNGRPFNGWVHQKWDRCYRWVLPPRSVVVLRSGIWVTEPTRWLATEPEKSLAPRSCGVPAARRRLQHETLHPEYLRKPAKTGESMMSLYYGASCKTLMIRRFLPDYQHLLPIRPGQGIASPV